MRYSVKKVKRKWCNRCRTRTPHRRYWYEDVSNLCPFWLRDKGICGCSLIAVGLGNEDKAEKPDKPCTGGFVLSLTCCRCLEPKRKEYKSWSRRELE